MTFIPARPARIRTTTHPQIRSHVPTPPSALPYHRSPTVPPFPNRTTVPYSQPHHRTTVPLHRTLNCTLNCTPNRTIAPPHRTPRHALTPPRPHPHHIIPPPHSRTIPTPAGRIDAVPTQYRRSTDAAPDTTGARVAAGPPPTPAAALTRRRPDAVIPLAVPVYGTRLQYPPVGRVVVRPKAGQGTGGVSQAPAIRHTLRTAHRIPRRPAGPTLVGPGRRVPLSPASPASSPSCASDTGTGQVQVH